MGRNKLQKFAELDKLPNVVQLTQPDAKNNLANFLKNKKQLVLELACGKGDYSLALAQKFPAQNFIGIDIQGERLWSGANQALAQKLDNVFFLRCQIENLRRYLPDKCADQIWLTFPDPFPKKSQSKKRLTNPRFLKIYKKILKPKGIIHLKTDDKHLFNYSIESIDSLKGHVLEKISDIYNQPYNEILNIQTHFEKKHLSVGKTINYLKFIL